MFCPRKYYEINLKVVIAMDVVGIVTSAVLGGAVGVCDYLYSQL